MEQKSEPGRITHWLPILLVRTNETKILGIWKRREINYLCGHTDSPLLHLLVSDTGTIIEPTTNDHCPGCFQLFIIRHSTVCTECGDLILPDGGAVGRRDYDEALEKGLIPQGTPPIVVDDQRYALFHHGHHPGMFSGNWTKNGYVSRDWEAEEVLPNGKVKNRVS